METPDGGAERITPPTESADVDTFETAQRRLFAEYGIDFESRFVTLERPAVRIHVVDIGEPGDEPPILFVHGILSFGAMFAPLLAAVGARRMIVIDRPGWGRSGDFEYAPATHRRTAVAVLEGVLDALDVDRVDIVGHSTGGYWGLVFALTRPDSVRRSICIGAVPSFPGTSPPIPVRLLTIPSIARLALGRREPTADTVVDQMKLVGERETIRHHPAIVRAMVAQNRLARTVAVTNREYRAFLRMRGWQPSNRLRSAELRTLQQRTVFVWGSGDFLGAPDAVAPTIESMPSARLEPVDAGHVPWLGHPERCATLVREARS